MTTTTGNEVSTRPYDFEIDADPYPVFRRIRDEAPVYYNEKYDFYALSRFEDVERGLLSARNYISGRGRNTGADQGEHPDPLRRTHL